MSQFSNRLRVRPRVFSKLGMARRLRSFRSGGFGLATYEILLRGRFSACQVLRNRKVPDQRRRYIANLLLAIQDNPNIAYLNQLSLNAATSTIVVNRDANMATHSSVLLNDGHQPRFHFYVQSNRHRSGILGCRPERSIPDESATK